MHSLAELVTGLLLTCALPGSTNTALLVHSLMPDVGLVQILHSCPVVFPSSQLLLPTVRTRIIERRAKRLK